MDFRSYYFVCWNKNLQNNKVWVGNELKPFFLFLIFLSEGGSMRSLSGKVLWCWVFLLICYLPLVWTTGWIRSKKRSGPWKDHEATAPVLILTEAWEKMRIWQQRHIIFCKKQKMQNTFLHIFYTFLHIFTHV